MGCLIEAAPSMAVNQATRLMHQNVLKKWSHEQAGQLVVQFGAAC